MTTINLYQNNSENEKKTFSSGSNGGFFFSLGILIVTLLVLFGLRFYNPRLEAKNEALANSVVAENTKLVGLKNLEQIIDMQRRLNEIKNNLKISDGSVTRKEMVLILDKFGLDVNKGTVISEYAQSENKITVKFDVNNFSDASKQIFSFKKSDYFTNVNLLNISRGEKGVSCEVEMSVNG